LVAALAAPATGYAEPSAAAVAEPSDLVDAAPASVSGILRIFKINLFNYFYNLTNF
jgi:hypothetical protein